MGLAIGASVLVATRVQALEAPTGRVVLTIEGAIAHTNQGSKAQFDMEMLERLALCCAMCLQLWGPRATTSPRWP